VAAIEARLVYLHVIAHDDLVARAERQHSRTIKAPAKRGDLLDRRGRVLATSADADTIYADPSQIENPAEVVAAVCRALRDCTPEERSTLIERFQRANHFAYVRRRVSTEQAARVAALDLPAIGFVKESDRFYPNDRLAANLIGYVGSENTGLSGIEHAYERVIRGEDGTILIHHDGARRGFNRVERPPTEGSTIELTIDQNLQHIVERELRAAVKTHRADSGSAIIMDPRTGEILAMASDPSFDPNEYRKSPESAWRNRAVQDSYEPGSTFKIVTASAAIDEKVMPVDTLIDTSPGILRIGRRVIDEYRGHNYQLLSFSDVLVKSSNVGAVKIGFRIGTERLGRYVERFGFGRPVSPDFPGEHPGFVWKPEQWNESGLASVSMGYQVSVTPLQMIAAFSAVANKGVYMEPRVLRAVERNGRRQMVKPKAVRQVVSADTAATLTAIMEEVVEEGTAKAAIIPGYTIAGKTGTAEKLIDGRYSPYLNYASFAGFLPSRKPELAIIVMIDSPRANGTSGGVVAAPVFKRIAESALRYLGVPPTFNPAPPVLVENTPRPAPPAARPANRIRRVEPDADSHQPSVQLVVDAGRVMPDVRGLSAREANQTLAKLGVPVRMTGDGLVVAQHPAAGSAIDASTVSLLKLDRTAPRSAGGAAPAPGAQP
jgi:cell division protein FtsI (penicillin-binding protein 3)